MYNQKTHLPTRINELDIAQDTDSCWLSLPYTVFTYPRDSIWDCVNCFKIILSQNNRAFFFVDEPNDAEISGSSNHNSPFHSDDGSEDVDDDNDDYDDDMDNVLFELSDLSNL